MHVLIDCNNYRAIATHDNPRALCLLAYIQFANVDVCVMPVEDGRPYAQFNGEELDSIYRGIVNDVTYMLKTEPYSDQIGRTRKMILAATHLRLPFSVEFLEEQAACIKETDDKPYYISTDLKSPKPIKAKAWSVSPQVNRPRGIPAGKPTARQLTEQRGPVVAGQTLVQTLPPAAPKSVPKAPKAPPAPKAASIPKQPRAPRDTSERPVQNGIRRPGAGGKTVVPWEVADRLVAKMGKEAASDSKGFRAYVASECAKLGCNPNMVNAQYRDWSLFHGFWKNGKK